MKINSLVAKTALAAAIASVSFGASAGILDVPAPAVVANEVFGPGSQTTSIRLPTVVFKADPTAINNVAGAGAVADGATIKLTLGGDAVFAENYQDPDSWISQGVTLAVDDGSGALLPLMRAIGDADVSQVTGGTAGDNQITIELDAAGTNLTNTATLLDIQIGGFKVQNLKSALERQGAGAMRTSTVTLEVREVTGGGNGVAGEDAFENTNEAIAFASVDGVTMTGVSTDYDASAGNDRSMIQVAAEQKLFTGTPVLGFGATAARDFDASNAINFLDLGSLTIERGQTVLKGTVGQGGISGGIPAGKETGVFFDFTGSDQVALTINSDEDFTNYGDVYLTTAPCGAAGPVAGDFKVTPTNNNVVIPTAQINLGAGTAYNLCATVPTAGAASEIPEASFSASMNATYFNVRYTDSSSNHDFGRVLRNGCQVTLFNVPNVNAADNAFVRFTNTSNLDGEVNAYIWTQDGERKDVGAVLNASLGAHETEVYHTRQGNAGVYLGDVLPEFAQTDGRSRLVIQGAFPSCEALGLVRSANGTLVNMTGTTNSDGVPSGTSNTSN